MSLRKWHAIKIYPQNYEELRGWTKVGQSQTGLSGKLGEKLEQVLVLEENGEIVD